MDIDINFKTSNVSQQDQEKLRKELEQVHKIFPYDNHICCCVHEKGKKLEAIVRIFCHSDQFGVYAMAKDSSQLLQHTFIVIAVVFGIVGKNNRLRSRIDPG